MLRNIIGLITILLFVNNSFTKNKINTNTFIEKIYKHHLKDDVLGENKKLEDIKRYKEPHYIIKKIKGDKIVKYAKLMAVFSNVNEGINLIKENNGVVERVYNNRVYFRYPLKKLNKIIGNVQKLRHLM